MKLVSTPSILSAAQALQDALRGVDPRTYSGDDAASVAEVLAKTTKMSSAASVQFAARAAECGAHRDRGYSDPSEWVARTTGESSGKARAELELAAQLDTNPPLKAAVDSGDVSLEEGVEIAKTESECPGSTSDMLRATKRRGLRGAKDLGRRKRQEVRDPQELTRLRRQHTRLRRWVGELGMRCGEYRLPPEVGVAFEKRLDAEIDRKWRAGDADYRNEPHERRAADVLATAVLDGASRPHSVRPELLAVYDVNDHTAHIPAAGPIDMATLRDIAKDAIVTLVTHDGEKVDAYSRHTKTIPKWLRVLIEAGPPPDFDGFTCLRCGRQYHLELDHHDPRANRGPTSWENIDPLCPRCHRDKTDEDRNAGLLDPDAPDAPDAPDNSTVEQPTSSGRSPP